MSDATFLIKLGMDTSALVAGQARANSVLTSMQNQFSAFGRTIAGGLGFYSLGYAVVQTVERMAEFQHSMKAVEAITGATGSELQKLKDNALDMAAAFKANDIAQFELEMSKMGFSANQVIDLTQSVINLATATGEDLVKSGEIAGATMRQFGLEATDMGRITDVMTGALNDSSMKLTDFGEAMKYVGPVARQAGMSLEDLAGWMVVLANNGVKSSMMGTSLRRIITDLGLKGEMSAEGLRKFGTSALSTGEAYDEFGRIAQSVALIMSHNGDVAAKETERLKNMNGVTAEQARIAQDDLVGAWNRLGGAWDRAIQKGTTLELTLQAITDGMANMIDPKVPIGKGGGFLAGLGIFPDEIRGATKDIKELSDQWRELFPGSVGMFGGAGGTKKDGDAIKESVVDTVDSVTKSIKELTEAFNSGASSNRDYVTQLEKFQKKLFEIQNFALLQDIRKKLSNKGTSELPGSEIQPQGLTGTSLPALLSGTTPMMEAAIKTGEKAKGLLDGFHTSAQRMGYAFIQMGSSISNGLAAAIAGTMPFAQAMAQMANSVVDSIERIVLAKIIEKAVDTGITPWGAIAGAIAGFAAIKSIFAKIGQGGGGGASGNVNPGGISNSGQQVMVYGQTRISGTDLQIVWAKQNAVNGYTGAGTAFNMGH